MHKSNFFEHEIKDNNYKGLSLSKIDEVNKTGDKSQSGIFKYLQKIEQKFSSVDIKDLTTTITFGEEFDANEKQKLFEVSGDNFDSAKIYTFNIVGSILYKENIFNINSRFGKEFLQYMIASSEGFLELEYAGGVDRKISIAEWLMIYYFKIKLKKAFALGVYKIYSSFDENLNKVRGQIDINYYIKKGYFDGKVRCSYKEHSFSNDINYVISLAINKVFKNNKYVPIVKDIHTIKNAFNQIEYKKRNIKFLKNTKVQNPFYGAYNEVFKLAYNILDDNFGSSAQENFSAFLFDISLLFEHHIRSLLKTKFTLDMKNKKEYKVPNGCGVNNIYPDVIMHHEDKSISIYDVKYKHFKGEVDRNDRFQLIGYVAMYLNGYTVKECGFIYPANIQKDCIKPQILNVAGQEIPFKIILYDIFNTTAGSDVDDNDENKEFEKFKKNQKENDKVFLNKFKKVGTL